MKIELTKQWLDRSRHLPLYLSLVDRRPIDEVELLPTSLIPLFNVLQNVAPRWHKLVLGIPATLYTPFLGELTCAPTLETLKLITDSFSDGVFRLPHTPLLKHLHKFALFLSEISIGWGNITTFEAQCVSLDEFFEVLRLAERLDSFRMHGLASDIEDYPLPTTPITHSVLRELYLEAGDESVMPDPSHLETLLNLAVFPSLEKFGYKSASMAFFPTNTLPSIFNRSHCQLTHFHLSGHLENGTSDDLISILSDLPTITHFKLEDNHSRRLKNALMSDELLLRITPIPRGEFSHISQLLPRLESLEFLGYRAFSWSCLAGLVSAASSDGGLILPSERQWKRNSIRRISFTIYYQGKKEFIDTYSLTYFKCAWHAGISIAIVNEVDPEDRPPDDALGNLVFPLDLLR